MLTTWVGPAMDASLQARAAYVSLNRCAKTSLAQDNSSLDNIAHRMTGVHAKIPQAQQGDTRVYIVGGGWSALPASEWIQKNHLPELMSFAS